MFKRAYYSAMSLAPSTEANFFSILFTPKKRTADAVKHGATGIAKNDIEYIALETFFIIHRRRRGSAEINPIDHQTIASAAMKITSILAAIQVTKGKGIDRELGRAWEFELSARLIDHAIWQLMTFVSSRDDRDYIMTDAVAAYVMMELLFPLKFNTIGYDCESLLYKTVFYSSFKFGDAVFAAVVSRNDQLFRELELNDDAVIDLFEKRYKRKVGDVFVAKR